MAGEGVGALLLKPLEQAQSDGDHIYGVVKSSVINHGGRTSGYTVPSPVAQSELIAAALKRADCDADSISYIEAHGTGTELGDPIEIQGATDAFNKTSSGKQFCAIGSVKTNIGHLEAAAGVAGATKLLLQLHHKKLVPSLHSKTLNQHIDFAQTPFYVQQKLADWSLRANVSSRRAGLSSFGAGGSNAHVVFEEAPAHPRHDEAEVSSNGVHCLVVLSARKVEQLKMMARRLKEYLASSPCKDSPEFLRDLAFTLQTGRLGLKQRVAFLVNSPPQLDSQLDAFLAAREHPQVWQTDAESRARKKVFEASENSIDRPEDSEQWRTIARAWTDGVTVDWLELGSSGRRLALPTYCFERVSHWMDSSVAFEQRTDSTLSADALHPMLDSRQEHDSSMVFNKRFTLEQYVFNEHIVAGKATLPGVGYMELAMAAARQLRPADIPLLRNLIWSSPINSDCNPDIAITLDGEGDEFSYAITTGGGATPSELHSQGKILFENSSTRNKERQTSLDAIKARCSQKLSKTQCYDLLATRHLTYGHNLQTIAAFHAGHEEGLTELKLPSSLSSELEHYCIHPAILDGAVQSIISLLEHTDTDCEPDLPYVPFVLSELQQFKPIEAHCFAHLSIQPSRTARKDIKKITIDLFNPAGELLLRMKDFSFKAMLIDDAVSEPMQHGEIPADLVLYQPQWQPVQLASNCIDATQFAGHCGIVMFDDNPSFARQLGQHLTRLGCSVRCVAVTPAKQFAQINANHFQLDPASETQFKQLFDSFEQEFNGQNSLPSSFVFRWGDEQDFIEQTELALSRTFSSLFGLGKALLANRKKLAEVIQIASLHSGNTDAPPPGAGIVDSFAKSLCFEGTKVQSVVIGFAEHFFEYHPEQRCQILLAELLQSETHQVHYRGVERYLLQLTRISELDGALPEPTVLVRDGGCYLITGGAGGLGLLFAQHMISETDATVVLCGRSAETDEIRQRLITLNKLRGRAKYLSADLTDESQVDSMVEEIVAEHGALNGVIHAAGVTRDGFLWNKTVDDFHAVVGPKVLGTVALDRVTRSMTLDYFVLFSSIAARNGNMGQTDYAMANRFMDDFAITRQHKVKHGLRQGRSLSINWPLWRDGGMQVNDSAERWLKEQWGMTPLDTRTGLDALHWGFRSDTSNIGLVSGEPVRLMEQLDIAGGPPENASAHSLEIEPVIQIASQEPETQRNSQDSGAHFTNSDSANKPSSTGGSSFVPALKDDLIAIVCELLKMQSADVELSAEMSTYGFDSVTFTEFTNVINSSLNLDLTPIIFFEQETLEELVDYLLEDFSSELTKHYSDRSSTSDDADSASHVAPSETLAVGNHEPSVSSGAEAPAPAPAPKHAEQAHRPNIQPSESNLPIAVVGMSGIMPQSKDLKEFWANLTHGIDMVTEVPKDRWDWQQYYGEPDIGNSKTRVKWGGFIPEVDKFDASFFNISPFEAELTDPQQRLFLETVWHTIEDAGYPASELNGSNTGVFVGIGTSDYHEMLREQNKEFEAYSVMGMMHAVLANRISYFFNWSGPSEPIGTACSSSLVAIDRAIRAIRSGQCDLCIAGGISLLINPGLHIGLDKAGMLAQDGRCKTFDEKANGYVRSEGVGAILLKPLTQAEADGDRIYGVIKGTAVNHGGHVNTFTTPNPKAQTEVVSMALNDAGVHPSSLSYIETHGTGTALGDPIEIQALSKVFKREYDTKAESYSEQPQHCGLGAVKSNLGHLELAAGMAGIFKLMLALRHKQIPANINFESVNPYIDLQKSPFYLVTENCDWRPLQSSTGETIPRRAGISSFGFGGVNAHLIVEEYAGHREATKPSMPELTRLVPLSTKYADGLVAYARLLLDFIEQRDSSSGHELAEIAGAMQVGREPFDHRLLIIASDLTDLKGKLRAFTAGRTDAPGIFVSRAKNQAEIERFEQRFPADRLEHARGEDIARYWVSGGTFTWSDYYSRRPQPLDNLPLYPFSKQRYWLLDPVQPIQRANQTFPAERQPTTDAVQPDAIATSLPDGVVAERISNGEVSDDERVTFKLMFAENCSLFADHRIAGTQILPAAAYLEIGLELAEQFFACEVSSIVDAQWLMALTQELAQQPVHLTLRREGEELEFVFSAPGSNSSYSRGRFSLTESLVDFDDYVAVEKMLELDGKCWTAPRAMPSSLNGVSCTVKHCRL